MNTDCNFLIFIHHSLSHHDFNPLDVESQELVLDVVNQNQVVLARKCPGQRSQLWRMTTTGQLQHEGSSPPSHPHQQRSDNILVLDIEGLAPHPSSYTRLMLRRPDPRRRSTQTWRFTDEGRLCCAHYNMCVQAQDGFFGLRPGEWVCCPPSFKAAEVAWNCFSSSLVCCRGPRPCCSLLATVYVSFCPVFNFGLWCTVNKICKVGTVYILHCFTSVMGFMCGILNVLH